MNTPTTSNVLLMSDDEDTAQIWTYVLAQKGITVTIVSPSDEESTEHRLPEHPHDVIVIDAQPGQTNPLKTVRHLRTETSVPVLFLLSQEDETHILAAYEAGVDEVIVGMISPRVFQAKVMAWLRRSWTVPTTLLVNFQVGDLRLEPSNRQVVRGDGVVIKLTSLEYRLLHLLMSNPGQELQSSLIVTRMWGTNGEGDTSLLKNIVYRLRRKIEPNPGQPRYIQSAPGEGYLFTAPSPE